MLWFLDTLVTFPVSHADGVDGLSVMESLARRGDSPPHHVHHTEDEAFHLLEGELGLVVTTNGDFERFVREAARPAETAELPPSSGPPTPEQQLALAELSLRHGIELIGPPLAEEIAAAA